MTDAAAAPVLHSVLTCPVCGHATGEDMPRDVCVVSHACGACGLVLRPRPGDCCVFCSYGTLPCPPVQIERACGRG